MKWWLIAIVLLLPFSAWAVATNEESRHIAIVSGVLMAMFLAGHGLFRLALLIEGDAPGPWQIVGALTVGLVGLAFYLLALVTALAWLYFSVRS